jgi:hypothetical protein
MRYRHDGFTGPKRRRFLRTLAKTGCIADAARVAGISTTTADRWRAKEPRFARACENAIDMASSHIETLAWERAVTGIEEPVIHYGKLVGTRIRRSDAIFRMLLMASNRKKYGRMGAVKRKEIEKELRARIKAELRAEIEAEVRKRMLPRVATDQEVHDALVKRLTAFGIRVAKEKGEEGKGEEE